MGVLLPLLAAWVAAAPGAAQQIPREEYLRFVPLVEPRIVGQTEASRDLALFGDPDDPGYVDVAPRDGIDDRRAERLSALAVRFAPYLVRNTAAVPVDVRAFLEPPISAPLHLDVWDLSRPAGTLVSSRRVETGPAPTERRATEAPRDRIDLAELVRAFHPWDPPGQAEKGRAGRVDPPAGTRFHVLFFDLPGEGPSDWRKLYGGRRDERGTRALEGRERAFVHPFLRELEGGYELVLQYWFFYPFNEGGNKHEGDWEHINVAVAPRGKGTTALSRSELLSVLEGPEEAEEGEAGLPELVVGRVDYYFHRKVMSLDFLEPDAYAPRSAWRRRVEALSRRRVGEAWIWERIREMAYRDPAESAVNTHPVVYIGANNKGTDQLMAKPGGANRDSHGSYPFPGLYKGVGPMGAAEQVNAGINPHHDLHDPGSRPDPRLVRFDDPARLELLPDWERVADAVLQEPEVRRAWAWLLLPVRWGYPAVRSPFAGIVAHAGTGNLSPLGPAYHPGWNRAGVTPGSAPYEPHRFGGTFPLAWQDGFSNSWGYLNLTLPTLAMLPPFDLLWRVVLAPIRMPFRTRSPTFFPSENVPFRLVGAGAGASVAFLGEDFALLLTAPEIREEVEAAVRAVDPEAARVDRRTTVAAGPVAEIALHVGRRFVSENSLRRIGGRVGFDVRGETPGSGVPVRADLELWEYAGSLRYNLWTESVQPFVRAGYGLSWYRLRNATADGRLLEPSGTGWVRRPALVPPRHLFPNTWHVGLGVEALPFRNVGGVTRGLDVSVRASWSLYRHDLGLEGPGFLSEPEDVRLGRSHLDLGLSVSF